MTETQTADSELSRLARNFAASEREYTSSRGRYQEAEARSEFIDPFLSAFGWDLTNAAGVIASAREVLREESQQREDSFSKKPDYTLRHRGQRKLYVEAKKPSVDILRDMEAIHQARAYGYTDGHPIVVLTNFRDVSVYDTSVPASDDDQPETCRLFTWHFSEYKSRRAEISAVLGRESVIAPNWTNQFSSMRPEQAIPAGQAFVAQVNTWRKEIGANIIQRHPETPAALLNDVVQKLINRLVFVRMCEDRGIEGQSILREAAQGSSSDIEELFKRLHRRYNTGLFDASQANAEPELLMDSALLTKIINRLYSPYSPFSFAVLDADFLGLVYETSLSEHLVIESQGELPGVRLNKKLEYSKRDVVTTPQELVNATVREAWKAATIDDDAHPRVLDFAVGSGRFLVSAFNQYLEQWTNRLVREDQAKLIKIGPAEWRLPFDAKCSLLKDNFFGIDVDFNAVEIARFSLLVRLLEDESAETLPAGQKILPDLDANIVHGNTLVRTLAGAAQHEIDLAVPLDLARTVFPPKFDVIIGNPPYMKTEEMRGFNRAEFAYLKNNYELLHQQFDKYIAFLEFSLEHLAPRGVVSVVVPNKWMTIVAGKRLRDRLRSRDLVTNLANFRHVQVFEDKSIYVCALTLAEGSTADFTYSEPATFEEYAAGQSESWKIGAADFSLGNDDAWVLPANEYESKALKALNSGSVPMEGIMDLRNGIQTSKNKVYILTDCTVENGLVSFTKNGIEWSIEHDVTRPYIEDSRSIRSHHTITADARVVYPYRVTDSARNSSGVELIPLDEMKSNYPLAYEYLEEHSAGMSDRNMGQQSSQVAFYAYGRVQAIGYCSLFPKIIYSVNQTGHKYGLDETGIAYSSGGTAGEVALYPKDSGYSLDFVLALLDQKPIEFFLRKRGSPFRGGYFARGTDVMDDVPVPLLDFSNKEDSNFHERVTLAMQRLRELNSRTPNLAPSQMTTHVEEIRATRAQIEDSFANRWRLSPSDYPKLGVG